MNEDLEKRLKELEGRLGPTSSNTKHVKRTKKRYSRFAIIISLVMIPVLLVVAVTVWQPWKHQSVALPKTITSKVDFPVYYYPDAIPHGFKLDTKSVSFSGNILFFNLIRDKQAVSFSQQANQANLDASQYPNAEKVVGADGKAVVTFDGTKVIGGLFSNSHDGKRTLVLVNSIGQVDSSDIKDLLRGLRKVN